ncbi:hypothetical protein [Bradyrhizobium sp. 27S5]|uniref:hypothetical protein n=1 Tax=Bradyrhizobium sp. 27S5 TaxID=3139728 RepID=UPI0030CDA8D5
MAETIIPAKRDQRIWLLNNQLGNPWHLVDVIAWVVNGHDQPVPITPFGRFDTSTGFVLGTETGWMALPNGPFFRTSTEAAEFLRSRQ